MTEQRTIANAPQTWRGWAGAGFAALWGAVAALFIPGPERGLMEDSAAFAGKLFGFGLFWGLLAAFIAQMLILRGLGRKAKLLTYLAGAIAGGLAAVIASN